MKILLLCLVFQMALQSEDADLPKNMAELKDPVNTLLKKYTWITTTESERPDVFNLIGDDQLKVKIYEETFIGFRMKSMNVGRDDEFVVFEVMVNRSFPNNSALFEHNYTLNENDGVEVEIVIDGLQIVLDQLTADIKTFKNIGTRLRAVLKEKLNALELTESDPSEDQSSDSTSLDYFNYNKTRVVRAVFDEVLDDKFNSTIYALGNKYNIGLSSETTDEQIAQEVSMLVDDLKNFSMGELLSFKSLDTLLTDTVSSFDKCRAISEPVAQQNDEGVTDKSEAFKIMRYKVQVGNTFESVFPAKDEQAAHQRKLRGENDLQYQRAAEILQLRKTTKDISLSADEGCADCLDNQANDTDSVYSNSQDEARLLADVCQLSSLQIKFEIFNFDSFSLVHLIFFLPNIFRTEIAFNIGQTFHTKLILENALNEIHAELVKRKEGIRAANTLKKEEAFAGKNRLDLVKEYMNRQGLIVVSLETVKAKIIQELEGFITTEETENFNTTNSLSVKGQPVLEVSIKNNGDMISIINHVVNEKKQVTSEELQIPTGENLTGWSQLTNSMNRQKVLLDALNNKSRALV